MKDIVRTLLIVMPEERQFPDFKGGKLKLLDKTRRRVEEYLNWVLKLNGSYENHDRSLDYLLYTFPQGLGASHVEEIMDHMSHCEAYAVSLDDDDTVTVLRRDVSRGKNVEVDFDKEETNTVIYVIVKALFDLTGVPGWM